MDGGTGRILAQLGRNDPCPCGSGKKYKKCCWPKISGEYKGTVPEEEQVAFVAGLMRLQFLAEARDKVDATVREDIEALFTEDAIKDPTTTDFIPFVQPLLEISSTDPSRLRIAVNLGLLCWKLAMVHDDTDREEMLQLYLQTFRLPGAKDSDGLKQTMSNMVERHRAMFPHLHPAARPETRGD